MLFGVRCRRSHSAVVGRGGAHASGLTPEALIFLINLRVETRLRRRMGGSFCETRVGQLHAEDLLWSKEEEDADDDDESKGGQFHSIVDENATNSSPGS